MITTNILFRVFHIQNRGKTGTCFTIDVDNKQYLVTAKHVIEGLSVSDRIQIFYEQQWKYLDVVILGKCDGDVDVAVLRPSIQLSPPFPLEPTTGGITIGQDIYFLGFPYGNMSNLTEMNRGFPLPLIKKGILSAIIREDGNELLFLDGHNNRGFSGGPVIFSKPFEPPEYKVAGVIRGNLGRDEPIYDENKKLTALTYRYNTGIIIADDIRNAVDIIYANPDGWQITNGIGV
ncbi:MAG TPA: serine protease [Coleofasciculaceae cyanobacterium]|jgi:hypothetical protein